MPSVIRFHGGQGQRLGELLGPFGGFMGVFSQIGVLGVQGNCLKMLTFVHGVSTDFVSKLASGFLI